MYRYSKNAQTRFMRVPELCYLFNVFSLHPQAKELTAKKLETKPIAYQTRILTDIERLAREALIALHESDQTEKSQVYL